MAAAAAKRATSTIPIVVATGGDSVLGLVTSLARPGGNLTGPTSIGAGLAAKRFDLLCEAVPRLSRLGVLWTVDNPASATAVREIETAARTAKVALSAQGIRRSDEIPAAFSTITRDGVRAVFVVSDPLFHSERQRVGDLAIQHKLPSCPPDRATRICSGAPPSTWKDPQGREAW